MTPTVLIVDDEPNIRAVVRAAAAADGSATIEAATAAAALDAVRDHRPDVVLLDLALPDADGLAVCRAVRRWSTVPIIVLSARHTDDDKAALLDAGADDYLTKPFSTVELRARIRAQLRRASIAPPPGGDAELRIGDLLIDFERRSVSRGGESVHLTPTEWALLRTMTAHAGRTLTHRQLFDAVWGRHHGDAQQYLRVYVANVRRKLERDPLRPALILTEPGVGYRFELPAAAVDAHGH